MQRNSIREKWHIGLLCLIASGVLMLLCSQCSPLYPINVWVDANCLLTVGRVMREGGVLYQEIYEQKGPLLYLLHAAAACISDSSFLGVYVMEVVSFAAALYMACRLAMRRMGRGAAICCAVLVGACVLVGSAFSRGDSAEEFCLPYLMGALSLAMRHYGEKDGPMPAKALFACGLMAGMVATIKFTILGLFVGLCIAEGVLALRDGGMKRALRSAGVFLAGMLLPIGAWCAYFAWHGALGDFYTAYVYNNIFLYSDEARGMMDIARDIWAMIRGNLFWVLLAGAGKLFFLLDRRQSLRIKCCVMAMGAGAFASVFLLGRTWPYSPLVLSVFAFAWFPLCMAWVWDRACGRLRALGAAACCVLALALALFSPNAYLRGVPLAHLAQANLAEYVPQGATVLQYSHLDDGLYLTTGTLPQHKYFVRLNVNYDEMYAELDRYVEQAIPDYVLTAWKPLEERFDRYQLIAEDAGYDDSDRINKPLYLYRRK